MKCCPILQQTWNMLTIQVRWVSCYVFRSKSINRPMHPLTHRHNQISRPSTASPSIHPSHSPVRPAVRQFSQSINYSNSLRVCLPSGMMIHFIKVEFNLKSTLVIPHNFSVRFRYGIFWAPRHPSTSVTGTTLYSFTLEEDESLETLEFKSMWVVGSLRFNTNKRSSDQLGIKASLRKQMSLKGVVYFTGAWTHFSRCYGYQVSKLSPRMSVCQP